MTESGLSVKTGKTREECREYIRIYFEEMPAVHKTLVEDTKEELVTQGFVRSIFGRFWHLDDMQKRVFAEVAEKVRKGKWTHRDGSPRDFWDHPVISRALRQAGNFKIQSATSDVVLLSLIKMEKVLSTRFATYASVRDPKSPFYGMEPRVQLMNEIHDSVVVLCDEDLVYEVALVMKDCMEHPDLPFDLPLPWVADVACGDTMNKNVMEKLKL
jgi:DNA polymerase I-like protein with 3'-5' exonuclease and polymerase domains